MVISVGFGSRQEANQMRGKIGEYLAPSDSRVEKTVKLKSSTPDRIVDRVKDEAFASGRDQRASAGMTQLGDREQQSLKRQHSTFSWQEHGFEAMRVKAALERKGVTEWQDYYDPGEGVQSALGKLQAAKGRAAGGGGRTAVGGDYTDEEEMAGRRRQRKQAERVQAGQLESAKLPAFKGDTDAAGFLRDEQRFDDDLFDIAFSQTEDNRATATGTDVEKLRDANRERSKQARRMDDLRQAPITYDPLEWAEDKSGLDFPGVDTLEPAKKHAARTERAQEADENESAPIADNVAQWADDMDQYDWPGIDTPMGKF